MTAATISRTRTLIGYAGGLITIAGMAEAWGVSRQAAREYTEKPGFPDELPLDVGRSEDRAQPWRVWLYAEVDLFRPLSP